MLVTGDHVSGKQTDNDGRPSIVATESTTWPDSLDVMGWNFDNVGMQVVFSRSIPGIVKEKVRSNLDEFLHKHGIKFEDVRHLVAHPGGTKVIEAYEQALDLSPERLDNSRAVLREFGNMSSPSVLFALARLLADGIPQPGDYAIVTALGPGFSAENLLLQF